jgi:hypothetical protein
VSIRNRRDVWKLEQTILYSPGRLCICLSPPVSFHGSLAVFLPEVACSKRRSEFVLSAEFFIAFAHRSV